MTIPKKAIESVRVAAFMVGLLWLIHGLKVGLDLDLRFLGNLPRHTSGIYGILTSPLIHADIQHLISNSVPLFLLTSTIFFFYRKVAARAFVMIYILTGLMVWLFAKHIQLDTESGMEKIIFHIGASGVVYGLVCFIFWTGIFRKSLQAIILALVMIILYSGYIPGILPGQEGISWESHLLGVVAGIFTAYYYRREIEDEEKPQLPSWELEPEIATNPFLSPDTFKKTKQQRLVEAHQEQEQLRIAQQEQLREMQQKRLLEARQEGLKKTQQNRDSSGWYSNSTLDD